MSSFVLSLLSPVLCTMVCGDFKEGICKQISLDDVDEPHFSNLVRLACGEEGVFIMGVEELVEIGGLADRLQMEAVRDCIEDVLLKELRDGNCVEFLERSDMCGLGRLRKACYEMLRDQFWAVSHKEVFGELTEETLGKLLDDDRLVVRREEAMFEALVDWMKKGGVGLRGEWLLGKVRYGVFADGYLAASTLSALPDNRMLHMLVAEALVKKGRSTEGGPWDGVERLCEKWMAARKAPVPLVNLPVGTIFGADVLQHSVYVAIDPEGHILVSDYELHQIIVFNSDGSVARRLGSKGKGAGQFDWPTGIAVDGQGRIFVADRGNHRIQVLNADGSVIRCIGSKGVRVGQLSDPCGLTIDVEGHIVVAEFGINRIQVFRLDGSVVRHFGLHGIAAGKLIRPTGVAVDGAGRLVVADSGNGRVQVFNHDTSVALCFGSKGEGPGQLMHPYGVAVDREGRFIVADRFNDRVQVFNSDGSVARVIGATGGGMGQLRNPFGVAVDGAGRIVVAEGRANHRVQIF